MSSEPVSWLIPILNSLGFDPSDQNVLRSKDAEYIVSPHILAQVIADAEATVEKRDAAQVVSAVIEHQAAFTDIIIYLKGAVEASGFSSASVTGQELQSQDAAERIAGMYRAQHMMYSNELAKTIALRESWLELQVKFLEIERDSKRAKADYEAANNDMMAIAAEHARVKEDFDEAKKNYEKAIEALTAASAKLGAAEFPGDQDESTRDDEEDDDADDEPSEEEDTGQGMSVALDKKRYGTRKSAAATKARGKAPTKGKNAAEASKRKHGKHEDNVDESDDTGTETGNPRLREIPSSPPAEKGNM